MLKNMAVRLIAFVVAFTLVVLIVPGVERNGNWSILISALVYMVINATAGRILKFVTAPLAQQRSLDGLRRALAPRGCSASGLRLTTRRTAGLGACDGRRLSEVGMAVGSGLG